MASGPNSKELADALAEMKAQKARLTREAHQAEIARINNEHRIGPVDVAPRSRTMTALIMATVMIFSFGIAWVGRVEGAKIIRDLMQNTKKLAAGTPSAVPPRAAAGVGATGGSTAGDDSGRTGDSGSEVGGAGGAGGVGGNGSIGIGAGTGAGAGAGAAAGAPGSTGGSGLEWGDSYVHYVVTTRGFASVSLAAPTAVAPPPAQTQTQTSPQAQTQTQTQRTSTAQSTPGSTVEVVRPDGTTETVTVPAESLRISFAVAAESALVAALPEAERNALVVVDDAGVIGPAGNRYIRTSTQLIDTGITDAVANTVAGPTADPTGSSGETASSDPADAAKTSLEREKEIIAGIERTAGVVRVVRLSPGVFQVTATEPMSSLASLPGVGSVGEDLVLSPAGLTPSAPEQAAVGQVATVVGPSHRVEWSPSLAKPASNARRATSAATAAPVPGPVIAVIDTGISFDQAELGSVAWVNQSEICGNAADDDNNGIIDDCRGWDFGSNDADPSPDPLAIDAGHGNAVASVIIAEYGPAGVASRTNSVGEGVQIMSLKVSRQNGAVAMSAVAAAIDYAAEMGASVINVSLLTEPGTDRSSVRLMEQSIALARSRGVLVVTSAGNQSLDLGSEPIWPASFSTDYDNVITVGATGIDGSKASFSNSGTAVTLSALGVDVVANDIDGSPLRWSGTSFAAPIVATAAARVIASGTSDSPADVRRRLIEAATTTPAGPILGNRSALGGIDSAAPAITGPRRTVPQPQPAPIVPVDDGRWSLTGMPVQRATASGTRLRLTGTFPIDANVTVVFAEADGTVLAEVEAASYGSLIEFTSPAVIGDHLVDVIVRFTTNRVRQLSLRSAFVFAA